MDGLEACIILGLLILTTTCLLNLICTVEVEEGGVHRP